MALPSSESVVSSIGHGTTPSGSAHGRPIVRAGGGASDAPSTVEGADHLGNGIGNGHGRGKEAGYTMVMFVMTIAVMSIMMGVAVQTAEFQMKREREAELIFRGQQFVEAIRLYKLKYGRFPMQLKEIYEAKPRVIRKKWKDPITDSENWGIVFLGQEGRQLGGRRAPGAITDAGGRPTTTQTPFGTGSSQGDDSWGESGTGSTDDGSDASAFGGGSANRKVGPIVGVHSTSCDEAVKIYEGHTTYCEWRFIYREPQQPGRAGGRGRGGARPPGGVHGGDWLKTPGPGESGGGTGNDPPGPIQTPRP